VDESEIEDLPVPDFIDQVIKVCACRGLCDFSVVSVSVCVSSECGLALLGRTSVSSSSKGPADDLVEGHKINPRLTAHLKNKSQAAPVTDEDVKTTPTVWLELTGHHHDSPTYGQVLDRQKKVLGQLRDNYFTVLILVKPFQEEGESYVDVLEKKCTTVEMAKYYLMVFHCGLCLEKFVLSIVRYLSICGF